MDALLRIIKYGRYIGVFPFKISIYMNEIQLKYSVPFSIYSSVLFVSLILSGLYAPEYNYLKMVRICHQTTNILASGVDILILSFKRRELECFINRIQKVDKLMVKSFKIKETKLTKIECCVFSLTILLMLFDFILYYKNGNLFHELKAMVLISLVFYLDAALIMNYKSCVKMIKSRIIQFRLNLAEQFSNEEIHQPIVTISRKLPQNNSKIVVSEKDSSDFSRMVKTYKNIFEACESLNNCFNMPLLISSIVCMINIIVSPFVIYVKIMETPADMGIYSVLGWLIGYILKLLILVEPCHSCQIQAKYMAQYLLRLSCITAPSQAEKLRKFHRVVEESPIEFHIGGVAKLSRSLLPAILSGFTTYLVILFQIKNEVLQKYN